MSANLATSLVGLLIVAGSVIAMVTLESSPLGLPFLLLGLTPVLAAGLLMTRHRYAGGFLRITTMLFVPFGFVALLPILLGLAVDPLPAWVVPTIALASLAGLASVVALVTGFRYLRGGA